MRSLTLFTAAFVMPGAAVFAQDAARLPAERPPAVQHPDPARTVDATGRDATEQGRQLGGGSPQSRTAMPPGQPGEPSVERRSEQGAQPTAEK